MHPLPVSRPTIEQVLSYQFVTVLLQDRAAKIAATDPRVRALDPDRQGFLPAIEVNSFDAARRIACRIDTLFPATASMLAINLVAGRTAAPDFDTPVLRSTPAIVQLGGWTHYLRPSVSWTS